jgi:hypothetical protein
MDDALGDTSSYPTRIHQISSLYGEKLDRALRLLAQKLKRRRRVEPRTGILWCGCVSSVVVTDNNGVECCRICSGL